MLEHDARVHGLEGREHVEAGEVLCACAIRSAEELEQVFAIVSGDDFVKPLVRRVGLQGGERVRELGEACFTCLGGLLSPDLRLVLFPVTDGGSLNVGALNAFILRLTSAVSLPFLTGSSFKMESSEAM